MGSSGTQGPDDQIGRVINGYRLERELGTGATGIVFLGRRADGEPAFIEHTRMDATELPVEAAIKILVLPWQFKADERAKFRKRFEREADLLRALDHPHILRIIAYGEDEVTNSPYMILPYLSGGTLQDHLESRAQPLPFAEVERLLDQIALAVDAAHSQGIVHRDIKPGNILLDAQGQAFLSDFSIARIMGEETTRLTRTGMVPGTPRYMAPEALAGQDSASQAMDIYSLGMVAYEMVVGPRATAVNPPPPPRALRLDLPEPAEAAILRALAPNPAQRFSTATAFARAFARGLQGQWSEGLMTRLAATDAQSPASQTTSAQTIPDALPTRPTSGGRRRALLGALAGALAMLLIVGLIFAVPGSPLHAMLALSAPTAGAGAQATSTLAQTASPTGSHTPGAHATATTKKGVTPVGSGGGTTPSATSAPPTATTKAGPPVAIYGDGSDGPLIISSSKTDLPLDATCSGSAGSLTLAFANASSSFAGVTGKPILAHQSQGNGAGTWMRNKVVSVSVGGSGTTSGTLTLQSSLNATYTTGCQVIVLPQYTSVTVTSGATWSAKPWNGTTGGILAFLANGTITNNGTISATGAGYRNNVLTGGGAQGEGTGGTPSYSTSANGNGGGGGGAATDSGHVEGGHGGGGGNGTAGGTPPGRNTGAAGTGGGVTGTNSLSAMTFGGAGGYGGRNYSGADTPGAGGNGGGIIYIAAAVISNTGTVVSNGNSGIGSSNQAGAGGGGAGGSILLTTHAANLGLVTAYGGAGGVCTGSFGGSGGVGGDGRVHVAYT